jgi:hypothetical protein
MANTTWSTTDKTANITLSGGNLIATCTNGILGGARATDRQVTGKFYWECTRNVALGGTPSGVGFTNSVVPLTTNVSTTAALGTCALIGTGTLYVDGSAIVGGFGAPANGSVVCIAVDAAARLGWFRVGAAGNWNNSGTANPATGVGGFSIPGTGVGIPLHPAVWLNSTNEQTTANFGDTAFVGAVPSGFTSGFTAGASVPTNAIASQALAEHWLTTDPDARITQVSLEHWASVASGNLQAVVTFVALEHWTSVAVVVPAAGGPMVTMIH